MTTFYRNMLDADEEKHAAAVAAASSASKSGISGPSLAIRPPPSKPQYDPDPEEGAYLRREAALQAAANNSAPVVEKLPATNVVQDEVVEINDEGAVVDHRVLLKGGLNITKKPIAPLHTLAGGIGSGGGGGGGKDERYQSRAVGASASYAERAARERKRLAEMLEEEGERKEREAGEREREVEELARKRMEMGKSEEGEAKRKAARERFEERKRRKLEEVAGVVGGKGDEE
jgi:coiled-coil domain-containing protein 55